MQCLELDTDLAEGVQDRLVKSLIIFNTFEVAQDKLLKTRVRDVLLREEREDFVDGSRVGVDTFIFDARDGSVSQNDVDLVLEGPGSPLLGTVKDHGIIHRDLVLGHWDRVFLQSYAK